MSNMNDSVIKFLQTANLLQLSKQTGLARSTLQRLKYGQSSKMTPGTRRLIMDVMVREKQ